jgi:predicted metalloprotease with PDZ domain
LESYKNLFGEFAGEKAQINLVPIKNNSGRWQAETRGNTLTIISGDMPFEKQSVQRLHEQLRHELFHLWIPNNLALTGNYDWFYEGFTVYQSLRTGLEMNRLSFTDFLETLAQALNLANFQNQQISLVEASKTRKSGANPEVYARGLLAAFLCDVALLQKNKRKRDLLEIFREIYQTHRLPKAAQDGNIAVLRILKTRAELRFVVENYIEGTKKIDWTRDLEILGIEEIRENSAVKLRVKDKLNGRQKDLLDKLGYNNWRKLAERSK